MNYFCLFVFLAALPGFTASASIDVPLDRGDRIRLSRLGAPAVEARSVAATEDSIRVRDWFSTGQEGRYLGLSRRDVTGIWRYESSNRGSRGLGRVGAVAGAVGGAALALGCAGISSLDSDDDSGECLVFVPAGIVGGYMAGKLLGANIDGVSGRWTQVAPLNGDPVRPPRVGQGDRTAQTWHLELGTGWGGDANAPPPSGIGARVGVYRPAGPSTRFGLETSFLQPGSSEQVWSGMAQFQAHSRAASFTQYFSVGVGFARWWYPADRYEAVEPREEAVTAGAFELGTGSLFRVNHSTALSVGVRYLNSPGSWRVARRLDAWTVMAGVRLGR